MAYYCLIPSCLPVDTTSAGHMGSTGGETERAVMVAGFLLSGVCENRKGLGSSLGVPERTGAAGDPDFSEVLAVLLGLGAAEVAAVLAHTLGPCRAPHETREGNKPSIDEIPISNILSKFITTAAKQTQETSMVVYTCGLSFWEIEAGGF